MTDNDKTLVEELRECEREIFGTIYGRAADRIEAQAAEIERLRGLLDAWLELAREHLDTELAGRTFAALRDVDHG